MVKRFRQLLSTKIIRFFVIGGCSTAIDFALYMFLSMRIHIILSKGVSMVIASVFSYAANKNFTFEVRERTNAGYLIRFYVAFALNAGTNVAINTVLFHFTGEKILSYIAATAGGTTVNFLLQKFYVFPQDKHK